jgi:hypothetical protein
MLKEIVETKSENETTQINCRISKDFQKNTRHLLHGSCLFQCQLWLPMCTHLASCCLQINNVKEDVPKRTHLPSCCSQMNNLKDDIPKRTDSLSLCINGAFNSKFKCKACFN